MTSRRQLFQGLALLLPSNLRGSWLIETVSAKRRKSMKREIIRVEPLATYLEKYKAPASMVTKHGDTIYVSGSPPFDPKTGELFRGPIDLQRATRQRVQRLRPNAPASRHHGRLCSPASWGKCTCGKTIGCTPSFKALSASRRWMAD